MAGIKNHKGFTNHSPIKAHKPCFGDWMEKTFYSAGGIIGLILLVFLSVTVFGEAHASGVSSISKYNPANVTITGGSIAGVTHIGETSGVDAIAGEVGEVITATFTAVSIPNVTNTNLTSISLTAGEWLIYSQASFTPAGAVSAARLGISPTSVTLPTRYAMIGEQASQLGASTIHPMPTRVNISVTTLYYLVAWVSSSSGAVPSSGDVMAIRIR